LEEFIFIIVIAVVICFIVIYQKDKNKKTEWKKAIEEGAKKAEILLIALQNNEISNDDTPIKLMKGEMLLHSISNVSWLENRKIKNPEPYRHLRKIARKVKGLSLFHDNIKPVIHIDDELKTIDSGTCYITTKKLILIGNNAKKIDFDKIVSMKLYFDVIQIMRETGKSVYLTMPKKDLIITKILLDNL
jgi:hypothetical protein